MPTPTTKTSAVKLLRSQEGVATEAAGAVTQAGIGAVAASAELPAPLTP